MTATARGMAVELLNRVESNDLFAEPLLDAFLSRNDLPHNRDRNLVTQLVYGTLRMRGFLDWVIRRLYRGRFSDMQTATRNILRSALYQLFFTERIPEFAIVDEAVRVSHAFLPDQSGLVNAILRNAVRRRTELSSLEQISDPTQRIAIGHSHPLWLVKQWTALMGLETTRSVCRTNNEIPPVTLRVNRLKTSRQAVMNALSLEGIETSRTLFSPDGLILNTSPGHALRGTDSYRQGHIQVQDEGSQLVAYLVNPQPGENILDACAGVGGKTGHLAEIMQNCGRIVAIDINDVKLRALRQLMERWGVAIVEEHPHDATTPLSDDMKDSFDRVLVDAPCSGLGTLRRNPEIKWRISAKDIKAYASVQKNILTRIAPCVKKRGFLIYTTCTALLEENENVITDFLRQHQGFRQIDPPDSILSSLVDGQGFFRTFPHRQGMDGFFGVVMMRGQQ